MGASTSPCCIPFCGASTTTWCAGPCASSNGSADARNGQGSSWSASPDALRACSLTGASVSNLMAGRWEPCKPRGFRTVLRAAGGAIPPADSPSCLRAEQTGRPQGARLGDCRGRAAVEVEGEPGEVEGGFGICSYVAGVRFLLHPGWGSYPGRSECLEEVQGSDPGVDLTSAQHRDGCSDRGAEPVRHWMDGLLQVGRHPQGVPEPGRVVPSPHAADPVEGMEAAQGSSRQPGSARYQLVPGVGVGDQRQGLLAHRWLSNPCPVPAELLLGPTRPAAAVSDLGTFQISLTNRRMRARMSGGVRGGSGDPTPLLDFIT